MGFLLAWRKHLNRCFVSVNHALLQHRFTQSIDQWLESHTGLSDPLGQGRASDCQPGATKDFLLPVERQVIGELGHHHVGQQACGWNTFVDDLRGHWRLSQSFALTAGPLATHMLLDRDHAWRVIQLFADIFADALKLAATGAMGVFWLVMNHGARKLRRQWSTFGDCRGSACEAGRSCFSSASIASRSVSSKSSSKLPCAGLICSLRLANL
ncbi:hypothetical protein PS631_05026 [Pseudomonas fluorescens]|nr:hypothetical protein PS631_05026 [Pseudomonas fluorescens]